MDESVRSTLDTAQEAWDGYLRGLPGKLVAFACKGDAGPVLPAGLHIDRDDILRRTHPPCEA